MKKLLCCAWAIAAFCSNLKAQLPADFPTVTVTTNFAAGVSDGYVFEAVDLPAPGAGYYAMILDNTGNPVWYTALTNGCFDFKVLPSGYLHYAQETGALPYAGGYDVVHQILDENYQLQETVRAGNGYVAECHDFKMLPNGNVLLSGFYLTQVDMSQVVSNGNPAALVSGAVLQELDGNRNVVWQWRFWDHYPFTSEWVNSTAALISEFHLNCVFLDNDGNLVVSTPNWVKKINRQTGDIMWHLGGTENQFSFVGVTQQEGINEFNSHDINRLPNGDVLFYNNSTFATGSTSRAHEYSLDETNKVATHVWTYTPSPGVSGPVQGSAQRLANGNTFIGWGGLGGTTTTACTEVSGTNVVFQMKFTNSNVISYRAFRFVYPPSSQALVSTVKELATGNIYSFPNTGVSIDVQSGGGGYNILNVTSEQYAPVYPLFQGKAPLVLPMRVSLSESSIDALSGTIGFDAGTFQFKDPTNLTIYYRQTTGLGLFTPQPTTYNPVTGSLTASISLMSQENDLGEFIFGYPDVADVPYPPILNKVESYPGVQTYNVIAPPIAATGVVYSVNQQLPIWLSWSPKGFARSYQVQISSDQDFSNTVVSVAYQNDAFYVFTNPAPNATYFYRVMTVNEGGSSDWSVGSFQTVAPFIAVVSPNGGEALERGLPYFIRWKGNVAESVVIQLYQGGVLSQTLVTNAPDNGAYQWQVGFNLAPGAYSIKITSSADSSLSAQSAATFSIIDRPTVSPGSVSHLADGRVQFQISVPGATQVSVLGSTNLLQWQLLQSLPLTGGSTTFTDSTAASQPALFYRLRVP